MLVQRSFLLQFMAWPLAWWLALNAQAAMHEIECPAGRDNNHASYLRRRYAETGSVQGVMRASVDALRQGLA